MAIASPSQAYPELVPIDLLHAIENISGRPGNKAL